MTLAVTCGSPAPGPGPLTEDEASTVLRHLMDEVYGVPVRWQSAERLAIVACTYDPVMAALAADALCRREMGDGYPIVVGGVAVDGPMEVVLLGPVEGELHWRLADEDDAYALSLCVVRPATGARS